MNPDLRAMTLSLAIEWAKSQSPEYAPGPTRIVEIAKEFEKHILGSGLDAPPTPPQFLGR